MTEPRIYLDYNATAPLRPEARDALVGSLSLPGNASSVHGEGRHARRLVEAARGGVAVLVGARPGEVVFTSGATEANVAALSPTVFIGGKLRSVTHLLVSAIEHPSVLRGGRFTPEQVERIPVDGEGLVDFDVLRERLEAIAAAGGTAMVAVHLANNETGVIEPIAELAGMVHAAGGFIHCDAVQAAGRVPIDVRALGVDTLAISAHKIGGAQGVGALVLVEGRAHPAPLITGGGQEAWRRAGTEPVAAIAAFGAAAKAALTDLSLMLEVAKRRDRLQARLLDLTPTALVFSIEAPRLANTLALAVPGVAAETAVIAFDLAGVALSSGSACSSGKVTPSHVLQAMGASPDLARSGLRISIGATTSDAEVDRFVAIWGKVIGNLTRARAG